MRRLLRSGSSAVFARIGAFMTSQSTTDSIWVRSAANWLRLEAQLPCSRAAQGEPWCAS